MHKTFDFISRFSSYFIGSYLKSKHVRFVTLLSLQFEDLTNRNADPTRFGRFEFFFVWWKKPILERFQLSSLVHCAYSFYEFFFSFFISYEQPIPLTMEHLNQFENKVSFHKGKHTDYRKTFINRRMCCILSYNSNKWADNG